MSTLTFTTLLIVIFSSVLCSNSSNTDDQKFQVAFQWQFINFTWGTPEEYEENAHNGNYKPEDNVMAGIKIHNDKMYIAMPRIRTGTPATLGYIQIGSNINNKLNPLITPYPDWNSNKLDGNCDHLQNVQSMEIDRNGTMWVLDGFRINKRTTSCPPKIVLLDLENHGTILQRFNFPDHLCLQDGGFLNDLVVDTGFAYITDNSPIDPGLIMFSRNENRAWKIRDSSMFPDRKTPSFVVGGRSFNQLAPIDGIALSPDHKTVYYCTLTGQNLYSIGTEILKNEELCSGGDWRRSVELVGVKAAASDGLVVDNMGDLYFGLLSLHGVGKWNVYEPFSKAVIVERDEGKMVWTDSFAFGSDGFLYLLANRIHEFFDPGCTIEVGEDIKFNVLKLHTGTQNYMY